MLFCWQNKANFLQWCHPMYDIRSSYGGTTTDHELKGPKEKAWRQIYMGVAFQSLCQLSKAFRVALKVKDGCTDGHMADCEWVGRK